MDQRPKKSPEPPTMVGLPPAPVDAPGPVEEDAAAEGDEALPSWSEELSTHSSWLPLGDHAGPPPGPPPGPADAPRPENLHGTDFIPVSDVGPVAPSPPSKPSSSGVPILTDDFDPAELAATRLVEGATLFRKYVLIKKLGAGGMGEVWKARHIELDCDRALKFIRTGLSPSPEVRKRFRREARVMAKVSHPNSVEIHDAFTVAGMAFIEMAYVPGQSLAEICKTGRPMPLDWTVRILQQLCEVLAVAHEVGIVHRDLKPANLMLLAGRPPGREFLKVLDFGIAKLLSIEEADGPSITNNAPIGTYPYMSPEQFGIGTGSVDTRSDIYSVGVILFEFLTGYRPHSAKNLLYQWIQKHLNEPIPTFRERNPEVDLPPAIEAVVRRCLARSPEDRPRSAQALFEEFDEASGLIRTARSGSSSYLINPPSRPALPATDPGSTPSAAVARGFDGSDPGLAPSRPSSLVDEVAGHSTFSGSFEVSVVSAPSASMVDLPTQGQDREGFVLDGGPSGPRRRPGTLARVAAGLMLVGSIAAGVAFVARPDKAPTKPPPPAPISGYERVPGVAGVLEWQGAKYDVYRNPATGQVVGLPEGYRPVGRDLDPVDGWPRAIERAKEGPRFIRVAGTTRPYLAGKPYCKAGDPEDGHWVREKSPAVDLEREVDIPGFYIQQTEVTNRELQAFYQEHEGDPKLVDRLFDWHDDFLANFDSQSGAYAGLPAVFVDVESARLYARWVGGCLPRRPEWEYAASSRGSRTEFVWDTLDKKDIAGVCVGRPKRREVGRSPKDVTVQGLFDMAGNVCEWSDELREGKPAACGGCFYDLSVLKQDAFGIKAVRDLATKQRDELTGFRVLLRCPPAGTPPTP